jgi:periplasmic protein TonB
MRRQLIICLIASLLVHVGVLWGGEFLAKAKEIVAAQEEETTVEVMVMPPQEPDTPEVTPDAAAEVDLSDLVPPSQIDVASASVDSAFTQQIQPPPPPRINKGGIIAIPTGPSTANIGKDLANVFDVANLDQRPEPRFQPNPKYPMSLKRAGITGSVVVRFIVDTAGDVRDATAIRSTHREFETPAIEVVMKSKFRPGKKGNAVVNSRLEQEIEFSLRAE